MQPKFSSILCADWSKKPGKRALYEACVRARVVRRVPGDGWTVERVLNRARESDGPRLVAFDAPLGVPASFLRAVRELPRWSKATSFWDWLPTASLDACEGAPMWTVEQPFFRVPRGTGSLKQFVAAAQASGIELRRQVEQETAGKSVFITAGIPGSVGSAALDLWRGLVAARDSGCPFAVWPFEDVDLSSLARARETVVAEIFPRAAYATALADSEPRARLAIAKTDRATRARALDRLSAVGWVRANGVTFEGLSEARASEDDFDALLTGCALLRCEIEGLPLWRDPLHAPLAEGGILGTGSIDLALPEETF